MSTRKMIIIGSGPAGYTAALYASRANLNPLMIAGSTPGGQLTTTTDVDNYPGFPEGILGPTLMESMKKQAARFGTEYLTTEVTNVDLSKRPFKVECQDGKHFLSSTLIIATGGLGQVFGTTP